MKYLEQSTKFDQIKAKKKCFEPEESLIDIQLKEEQLKVEEIMKNIKKFKIDESKPIKIQEH